MSKLKTLKAIQECANDKIDTITEEPCFFGFNDALDIFSEELREEAKKWIRLLDKYASKSVDELKDSFCLTCQKPETYQEWRRGKHEKHLVLGNSDPYEPSGPAEAITWIKYFFNLEKEK
jgi:hypothetical protein